VGEKEKAAGGSATKKHLVFMSDYTIHQKTGSPHDPADFSASTIQVNLMMVAHNDTHSAKHEEFLCELRAFLEDRNKGKE